MQPEAKSPIASKIPVIVEYEVRRQRYMFRNWAAIKKQIEERSK